MALFERKKPTKILIDDTESLICKIVNSHTTQGYTEYNIRIQKVWSHDKVWHISKRYSDFVALNSSLEQSTLTLPLPPKKYIGNMDRDFIVERLEGLQNYLNTILCNHMLALTLNVRRFLDSNNYSNIDSDTAFQHVSMAIRSESRYQIVKHLVDMGWRIRKEYYLAKDIAKDDFLLTWVQYGPDKYLEEKEMQLALKAICNMQHLQIISPTHTIVTETGVVIIRPFIEGGSLFDIICDSNSKQSFLKKYGNPKQPRPLSLFEVRTYGREILYLLKYLHDRGLFYGHLHSCNVFWDCGMIRLSDIENGILGVSPYYRPFLVQHRKINSLESIDVYCFGHLLYEMAFGKSLNQSTCDEFPTNCPASLRFVLESILLPESLKSGLPTISTLLLHPLFTMNGTIDCTDYELTKLKMSPHVKQCVQEAMERTLRRLREDQKFIYKQKKLAKVEQLIDEEDRYHKKKSHKSHNRKDTTDGMLTCDTDKPSRECSDSPNSISTANSVSPTPLSQGLPNAPIPPPLPPPILSDGSLNLTVSCDNTLQSSQPSPNDKTALMNSINDFRHENLNKVTTSDKSQPKIT